MTTPQSVDPTLPKPLRLWPGIVAGLLLLLVRYVVPLVNPEAMMLAVMGGLAGALAVLVWWAFFSRAPRAERWGVVLLLAVALLVTSQVVHASIANGMMGLMLAIFSLPLLSLALVAAAVAGRRLASRPRFASIAAAILLVCAGFSIVRTGGITGDADSDFHWRWTPTPEEQLLAQAETVPAVLPPAPAAPAPASVPEISPAAPAGTEPLPVPAVPAGTAPPEPTAPALAPGADWPGFRGPGRDSIVRGVRIGTDWAASPPVELWRQPVGPGWSSFAVRGPRFYTQEQRGEEETVSCYDLATGKPVWRHRDAARFWESNGGAGPRATPTLSGNRVYTLGATGILNALDAGTGAVLWTRNPATETKTEVPGWGFSGSPLVIGDVVVVAAAGQLAAYDAATGRPRWTGPARGGGYSSPHLATLGGVPHVLLLSGSGAAGFAPADGALLWEHKGPDGGHIVQPAFTAEGDVLVGTDQGIGRLAVAAAPAARGPWAVQERWTSNGLKPYFNDFVVFRGHAYGFDGNFLAAIDLADGKRLWKGGRYGHGQLLLLPEQDLLLVISEQGELALVRAAPDQFTELARFPAIQGKTWNHPVLAGDVLLVRNSEEMAAFRLSPR
jgi:outer membrane protein assembly factor BamB